MSSLTGLRISPDLVKWRRTIDQVHLKWSHHLQKKGAALRPALSSIRSSLSALDGTNPSTKRSIVKCQSVFFSFSRTNLHSLQVMRGMLYPPPSPGITGRRSMHTKSYRTIRTWLKPRFVQVWHLDPYTQCKIATNHRPCRLLPAFANLQQCCSVIWNFCLRPTTFLLRRRSEIYVCYSIALVAGFQSWLVLLWNYCRLWLRRSILRLHSCTMSSACLMTGGAKTVL
jgi:hypothetical protein